MSDGTAIEWTHRPGTRGETWNPIRARNKETGQVGWHCTHTSEGCRFCYAERRNRGFFAIGTRLDYKPGNEAKIDIFMDAKVLGQPLHWRAPRTIFVCSMTDMFADFVTPEMIDAIFTVAALCPQHTFIILTKRARRMRCFLTATRADTAILRFSRQRLSDIAAGLPGSRDSIGRMIAEKTGLPAYTWPLPNVWLGVSTERQEEADNRLPDLMSTPAAVRFVSAEPLLGAIDFERIMFKRSHYQSGAHHYVDVLRGGFWSPQGPGYRPSQSGEPKSHFTNHSDIKDCLVDWIIVGGESGHRARPMHPDWARSIRDQCAAAAVPFFFKQWGAWAPLHRSAPVHQATSRHAGVAWPDGTIGAGRADERGGQGQALYLATKKIAGRHLDGVEHNAFPQVRECQH